MQQKSPPVDPELVKYLSRVFPDKCPDKADSGREIWIAVGRQDVIRKLRKMSEHSETTVLESD